MMRVNGLNFPASMVALLLSLVPKAGAGILVAPIWCDDSLGIQASGTRVEQVNVRS